MKLSVTLVTTCMTLVGFSSAFNFRFLSRRQSTPNELYYLQTRIVDATGDCGTNKDGLYVYSHHTGAGLGDAGLSPNISDAMQGYLDGSQQLFTFPNNQGYPWAMQIYEGPYQQWNLVTISAAAQISQGIGFFFNNTGLQINETSNGWLACDWWHGKSLLDIPARATW